MVAGLDVAHPGRIVGEDAHAVRGEQPLVAARHHEVAELAGHGHHTEGMGGVHGQPGARTAGDLGAAGKVHALAGEIADLAHEDQSRAPVHALGELVEGEIVTARPDHACLDPALLEGGGWVDEGRVFQVGEDGVVARAPHHGLHRLVQALGGVGEEGHSRRLHTQHAGRARLGALVHGEELVASRHARALEAAHARGRLVVRAEPGRLATGAQVGNLLQTDEVTLGN